MTLILQRRGLGRGQNQALKRPFSLSTPASDLENTLFPRLITEPHLTLRRPLERVFNHRLLDLQVDTIS